MLTVNGRTLATDLRKGSPRREYEWGKVYTNQQHNNLLVVRIGGQPMFTRNNQVQGMRTGRADRYLRTTAGRQPGPSAIPLQQQA
jgi:hypothetical protein